MGSGNGLHVDQSTVESEASTLSGAASVFEAQALSPVDETSTITANASGKTAFQESQTLNGTIGSALDVEVGNIRSLGASFAEFDDMMRTINEQQ